MEKARLRTVCKNEVYTDLDIKRIKHINFTLTFPSTFNPSKTSRKRFCFKYGQKEKRRKTTKI